MSQTFDGSRVTRAPDVITLGAPCAPDDRPTAPMPAPTWSTQARASLRRLPFAGLAATAATVVGGAALLETAPAITVAVLAVAGVQLTRSRRPAGAPLTSALGATLRSVLVALAMLTVGLQLLGATPTQIDHALLLGVAAAAVGGIAAVIAAFRARPPRVLVVGDLPQVRGMCARWIDDKSVKVVGGLVLGSPTDVAESGLTDLGIASVGTIDDVVDYVAEHPTDLVVVAAGPAASAADVQRLSWALEHHDTRLGLIGATEHVAPHRIDVETVGGSTMALVARPGSGLASALVKASLDRVLAGVLTVVLLPVVVVAAIAIRLDSAGSPIFRQTRVGRDGRPFTVYKLRTMSVGAELAKAELVALDEGNGVLFKIHRDPRVTRVGRLLRRTSVDELPQLLNVLAGQMSLVGPRPALPEEVARYTEHERRRLVVKPGLTGLWQVSGRSSLSRERSMQLDTSYADNWRPGGDATILIRTVGAVVSRKGAY